MLYQSIGI